MIVFVYDNTDDLIKVVYDVIEIRKDIYNDMYVLRVCSNTGNDEKYINGNMYYLKVV